MALQPRERKLATIVGVLGGAMLLWLVVGGVLGAFRTRRTQLDALDREIQQKRIRQLQMAVTNEKFFDWGKRSLPRDHEVARTLYQGRLVAELNAAKLENVHVEPGRSTKLRDVYTKLPFTVRAQGSMPEIMAWLASFSEADDLHLIRELTLQPLAQGNDLQLAATIETLALSEADRSDKLTTLKGSRLDQTRAAENVKTIVDRNLFAAYVPPPPPRPVTTTVRTTPPPPPPKPVFDTAKYAFLTSIVSIDAEPQAWILVRTTDKMLKLRAGDTIDIGQFKGKLLRIGSTEIEIQRDGKRVLVALGKSLDQGVASSGGEL